MELSVGEEAIPRDLFVVVPVVGTIIGFSVVTHDDTPQNLTCTMDGGPVATIAGPALAGSFDMVEVDDVAVLVPTSIKFTLDPVSTGWSGHYEFTVTVTVQRAAP